jgi:hypothetical protein
MGPGGKIGLGLVTPSLCAVRDSVDVARLDDLEMARGTEGTERKDCESSLPSRRYTGGRVLVRITSTCGKLAWGLTSSI